MMKTIVFALALFALLCCMLTSTAVTAAMQHNNKKIPTIPPPPTAAAALKANANHFTIFKDFNKGAELENVWQTVQSNIRLDDEPESWFLQFNNNTVYDMIRGFDLKNVAFRNGRSYFQLDSTPDVVYVYKIKPLRRVVNGTGVIFSNFDYSLCSKLSLAQYQALSEFIPITDTIKPCDQAAASFPWHKGTVLAHYTEYVAQSLEDRTHGAPAKAMRDTTDLVYAGFDDQSEPMYAAAYGRTLIGDRFDPWNDNNDKNNNIINNNNNNNKMIAKTAPPHNLQRPGLGIFTYKTLTYEIDASMYYAQRGWAVPYTRHFFSITHDTTPEAGTDLDSWTAPLTAMPCQFQDTTTNGRFTVSMEYDWDRMFYYGELPLNLIDGKGYTATCTVRLQAQRQNKPYPQYSDDVAVRIHDIGVGEEFDFQPSTTTDGSHVLADRWLNYQQLIHRVSWMITPP